MKVIRTIAAMRQWAEAGMKAGLNTALVPTMGFLHEGHLSLVRHARSMCDKVVVSIFVNPAQFGPHEDLDRYPRDFKHDENLCARLGVDVVFYPSAEEIYPPHYKTYVVTEDLSELMCGRSRPMHFKGVTTIVTKLFNIVQPEVAVFGQKDAQQSIILQRMTADLNIPVKIEVMPTIRETDGLALSSRNKYLGERERQEAPVLYQSLELAANMLKDNREQPDIILAAMKHHILSNSSGKIDYIVIKNSETLQDALGNENEVLIALAVYFGKTRLIDNIIIRI